MRNIWQYHITFRCYPTIAIPANCVLSAKIKYFREERSTTQEKPAIADNGCYMLPDFLVIKFLFSRPIIFLFRLSINASQTRININWIGVNISQTGININGG